MMIMPSTNEFFKAAKAQLAKTKEAQHENILKAAEMFTECMDSNGIVQLVGLDNCRAFAMELGFRAGGLMPFHQFDTKDLAMRKVLTEREIEPLQFDGRTENAEKWMSIYNIDPHDLFLCTSQTGTEPVIVELAINAQKHGHKLIAVISQKASDAVKASHPSGKKLSDLADLVIDTGSDWPDTVVDLDGVHKVGQMNSICGNVIAQMITAETYRLMKNTGRDCPVLLSANVKDADVHNHRISDKYEGRWNS